MSAPDGEQPAAVTEVGTPKYRTKMEGNKPAAGAPKGWKWGYLPCGCRNDGFGGHVL